MQFVATAEATGGPATFAWQVQDNGGTANGGLDTLRESLTISITPINDIPVRTAGSGLIPAQTLQRIVEHEKRCQTIDHDHVQYYTLLSATRALATAGLAVVDAELFPTDGGPLRIWARPTRIAAPPTDRVVDVLRMEKSAGLHRVDGYVEVRRRAESLRQNLLRFLLQCRANGERVVGYGAGGVETTLLNYCGIRSDLVEYIVDRDPYRHGCFTPGTRIPIHDPQRIGNDQPDVVLALSWDLESELADQLSYIGEWGGRLAFPRTLPHLAASARNGKE